jgi:hypothetical protein
MLRLVCVGRCFSQCTGSLFQIERPVKVIAQGPSPQTEKVSATLGPETCPDFNGHRTGYQLHKVFKCCRSSVLDQTGPVL